MDDDFAKRLNLLMTKYRDICLWFMRTDFMPSSRAEILNILRYIEKRGDMDAFIEARRLREWLLQSSNVTFAD